MDRADFKTRYRGVMARLNHSFASTDEVMFETLIGELYAERDLTMRTGIARLSQSLANALTRFQLESRVATLAERDIPDARLRLDHVLKMTEEAVHRTLDLIEQSAPLAEATTRGARLLSETLDDRSHNDIRLFLGQVQDNAEKVRANLSEVMLAQGFQDLTGQILHGVRTLIVEVESVLEELTQISGLPPSLAMLANRNGAAGPAIPGIDTATITDQKEVDNLIAGLGI